MHALPERSPRNPSSQQLCGALTHESSVLFYSFSNITSITVTTTDLIHNVGPIIIRDAILRMGENPPKSHKGLHVDLNIDI